MKDFSIKLWQGTARGHSSVFRSGKYRNWDEVSMANAVEAVRRSCITYRGRRCLTSFHAKYNYTSKGEVSSFFTSEEEEEWLKLRKQIIALVQQIVESKGIEIVLSSGWWERYIKRYPQIVLCVAVPLSLARAMAADRDIYWIGTSICFNTAYDPMEYWTNKHAFSIVTKLGYH